MNYFADANQSEFQSEIASDCDERDTNPTNHLYSRKFDWLMQMLLAPSGKVQAFPVNFPETAFFSGCECKIIIGTDARTGQLTSTTNPIKLKIHSMRKTFPVLVRKRQKSYYSGQKT